jgi:hypothetical protein
VAPNLRYLANAFAAIGAPDAAWSVAPDDRYHGVDASAVEASAAAPTCS